MGTQVPLNIGPPNTLIFPIAELAGLDLTTVTGVTFSVRFPDGVTTKTWNATIPATVPAVTGQYLSLVGNANPIPTLLFAQYSFQTTDVTQVGDYLVAPQLTVAGGTIPCYARKFTATDLFGM